MQKIFTLVAIMGAGFGLASAQQNGSQVNVGNSFPGKFVTGITMDEGYGSSANSVLNYNDARQLISVDNNYGNFYTERIEFGYTGGTIDGRTYDMTISEIDEDDEIMIYIKIENGVAVSAYSISKDTYETETEDWSFAYDKEGHLTEVKRSQDDSNSTITLEYKDVAVISVTSVENDLEDNTTETSVSTFTYNDMLENTCGLMLFDGLYNADLDEMDVAYMAGVLGKPARYLPNSCKDEEDTVNFQWTFTSDGYVESLIMTCDDEKETANFKWGTTSGVNDITIDNENGSQVWYDLQGVRRQGPTKGLNIVRDADGTVRKVML